MAIPTIRAVGAIASGTGTISPGLPTGTVAGDLLLMFVETAGGETPTCSGWTLATSQATGSGTAGTKASILYKIAAGSDATTTNDPGDHIAARIIGITTGTFNAGDPINDFAGGVDSSGTTSVTVGGYTTDRDDVLVFVFVTGDVDPAANGTAEFSSWANSNLSSLTERIDNVRTSGNGGALGVASGGKATAGAIGDTTVTAATSSLRGKICLGINPLVTQTLSVETPLVTPSNLTATPDSSTAVTLAWADISYQATFADVTFSVDTGGGSTTTLNADAFSVAATFSNVSFPITRKAALNATSYAATFSDVTFSKTVNYFGDAVSYAATFSNVNFPITRKASLQAASFTATFADVSFPVTRKASLQAVSYAATFADVTFNVTGGGATTTLNAEAFAVAATFANAAFPVTRKAATDAFSIAATFANVGFYIQRHIDLEALSVAATFADAGFSLTRDAALDAFSVASNFADVGFRFTRKLAAESFAVTATFADVSLIPSNAFVPVLPLSFVLNNTGINRIDIAAHNKMINIADHNRTIDINDGD